MDRVAKEKQYYGEYHNIKSKYITELLVVFKAESERIEAIQQILSKKGIKCKTQSNIRRKIYAI